MNKIIYCVVESSKLITIDTHLITMTFHKRLTPRVKIRPVAL